MTNQHSEYQWQLCYVQQSQGQTFVVFSSKSETLVIPTPEATIDTLQKRGVIDKEERLNKLGEYYPAR